MPTLVDFLLHSDRHLLEFVAAYGPWVYGLLCAIIFAETGLVILPLLPGDSLLFAAGAIAATGAMHGGFTVALLTFAAVAGNSVNYAVGRWVGPRVFTGSAGASDWHRWVNRDYLRRAHEFFAQYGGKAVVLGRFVPIVRTFVPFVAGAAGMAPTAFTTYNATGAVVWVSVCVGAGMLFGNVPLVREHFSLVTLGIVAVSLLPAAVELLRHARARG